MYFRFGLVCIFVLLLLGMGYSVVTLSRASSIAQKALEVQTQPQSIPDVEVLSDGNSYYVIELDNYWLPVNVEDGSYSQTFDNSSFEAVKLHQFGKSLVTARRNTGYPTKLSSNFAILQGNVESKMTFYQTYIPQLPDQLNSQASDLMKSAQDLDNAIIKVTGDLDKLGKYEDRMLSLGISEDNLTVWRSDFSRVLGDIDLVVKRGYSFDEMKSALIQNGTEYAQNESNPLDKRNLVANFLSSVSIEGIPSSLPNYKKMKDTWANWFSNVMSDSVLSSKSRQIYLDTLDRINYIKARRLKINAYDQVLAVKTGFEDVKSRIGWCVSELPYSKRDKYKSAMDYYNKSLLSYNQGAEMLNQSNYSAAIESFQDAIGWSEKAQPYLSELSSVSCPQPNEPKQTNNMLTLMQKNWVYIVVGLVLLIIILALMKRKPKEKESEGEESYGYDYYGNEGEGPDYS